MGSNRNKMEKNYIQAVKSKLKAGGYKLTGPRLAILEIFAKEKGHFSVADTYSRIGLKNQGIGIATVYRTVDLFLETGILRVLTLKNSQPCFELNHPGDHHHHLICRSCGRITEFESCNFKSIAGEIEKTTRFIIEEHTLEAYGLCSACSSLKETYSTEKI
jgi:Fur family transcriptional regulator, ferric uptake regulator